ncbi:MAG: YdgA family protein [Neisseria sp.]|uniref:YdgA family protein n=1 Tax=Neisseria sp. TaxID=192066 RepID=UPI0026DCFD9A|nr:YdgA family protein [Neisseria sp.]MDO4640835.1 YdgA family protein [Neisseria sp.]
MKKLIAIGASGLVIALAAVFGGAPYLLGKKAEQALDEQQQMLAKASFLTVESHQYERGWFGATETTVVRLNPALLKNAQQYLPDNLKTILNEPVTIVNHVKHGPFADGFTPVSAKVETEFKYHPETEKALKRFFGDQRPLTLTNVIRLDGSGQLQASVPAFDYEELSGIKLNWKGLSGTTEYSSGWSDYRHSYHAPALLAKLADKGDIGLENLQIDTQTQDGKSQLSLGSSSFKIDKFAIEWKEGVDYHVKLNELINLVTDLQIGAFINPTGQIAPSKIAVDKLQFDTKMQENGGWINSEGRFRFANLAYGEEKYGPLDIDVAAEHLDAKSLLVLKNKMAEATSKEMSGQQVQDMLIQAAKTDAVGLFTNNPVIKVRTFDLQMPQGKVQSSGELSFSGLVAADLNDFNSLVKKTRADFKIQVPQKLLENLAIHQARNVFSVNPEDAAEGKASLDDINETLRLMVENTIISMNREGYIKVNNGDISTQAALKDGHLLLNGKQLQSEPDDMDLEGIGDAAASEASAPKP